MGRLLEHHAKQLLVEREIVIPAGEAADAPGEVERVAGSLGGNVVVKALAPVNRRAKAGAIRFATDAPDAARHARELLGTTLDGRVVASVLVEEQLPLEDELYLAFLIDKDRGTPLALASTSGGVDIEEIVARRADAVRSLRLDPWRRALPHRLRELWASAGLSGPDLVEVAELSRRAAELFFDADATVLELNPVGLVAPVHGGPRVVAVGVVLEIDDQAVARQPRLAPLVAAGGDGRRPPTKLEQRALAVAAAEPYRGTAHFLELEGEIGLLCGGGGGSLVFFDAVKRAGGRPACHTELGGNPSADKVRGLASVVLSCPNVRGLLVGHNITNNTQVDLVATGVVAALGDLGIDPRAFPVVAREVGTHDRAGREIFERAGIEYHSEESSMEDAARRIVQLVRASTRPL
jgi:succinyl-CoA synthetase beta subunit